MKRPGPGCAAVATAVLMAWGGPAGAQGFSDYVETDAHRAVRESVALRQLRTICPDNPVLAEAEARVRIVQPVAMLEGARFPEAGVWEESLAGCGDGRQINLIFSARAGGRPPAGTAMFPGTTRIDWFAQQQAMRPAAVAASKKAPDAACRRYAVADTDGGPAPAGAHQPGTRWQEDWLIRACDDFVDISVTLTVGPEGGIAVEAR